jgi:hypothetical protein
MSTYKYLLPVLMASIVIGCTSQPIGTPKVTLAPTEGMPSTEETSSTIEATNVVPQTDITKLNWLGSETTGDFTPNLWTKIAKDKITIYPYNRLSDYTYDKDGSLWMVGGFGVIHKGLDGSQTWYSVKNGLPNNFFTTIAISTKGEVWIGGVDNSLFRFDGKQWIDEGEKLPPPFDGATDWLCYSKDIHGIDFGPDGSAWVMNGGIEIYRQAYGQWVNIPFPKAVLPNAGGGGCPEGIRVQSDDNITIKIGPITAQNVPSGIQFDGQSWRFTYNANYEVVDRLIAIRHQSPISQQQPVIGTIQWSQDWPFGENGLLPAAYGLYAGSHTKVTADKNGVIWLTGTYSGQLFNNKKGVFQDAGLALGEWGDATLKTSDVLGFGTDMMFYAPGKSWRISDSGVFSASFSIDNQDRVWSYEPFGGQRSPGKGLVMVDHGDVKSLGLAPDYLFEKNIGGVIHLSDDRVWVGGAGVIWEFQNDHWQELTVPETDRIFTQFAEDNHGVVYGATDTGMYKFVGNEYTNTELVSQLSKPIVVPQDGNLEDCSFHIRYTLIAKCSPGPFFVPGISPPEILQQYDPGYNYKSRFLSVQEDGSVIYINNHLIAKLENGRWKSFLFDTFSIDSATVDRDGNIWIFSGSDGLFRLTSDIFNDYQALILP